MAAIGVDMSPFSKAGGGKAHRTSKWLEVLDAGGQRRVKDQEDLVGVSRSASIRLDAFEAGSS